MQLGHIIVLVDDYCKVRQVFFAVFRYFLLCILGESFAKPRLEQNIKSLLYNHLIYICAEETDF